MTSSFAEFPPPIAPEQTPHRASGRNSRSLAQQLFDQFAAQIRNGEWLAGEKLPTESELVQRFDVSRTVIREAISKLQTAALVETRHGIGTFVLQAAPPAPTQHSPLTLSECMDVLAVWELRICLETEAAGLAAVRRSAEQLDLMHQALDAFSTAHHSGLDTTGHDLAFHLAIAAATGNRYIQQVLGHFGSPLIPSPRSGTINMPEPARDHVPRVHHEHEEILQAIERQDSDCAKAAMRLHLYHSRERWRKTQPKT